MEEEERHLLYTKTKNQRRKVERIQRDVMDMTQRSNPFTPKKLKERMEKWKKDRVVSIHVSFDPNL